MSSIIVSGSTSQLSGEVYIQGSKNAALPIITASLLNDGVTVIKNCPKISDVERIVEALVQLGCDVKWEDMTLIINAKNISGHTVDKEIANKTRGSVLFLGSLLGRLKKAVIAYPGGCSIGNRPINYHVDAIQKLGVNVKKMEEELSCYAEEIKGADIHLNFPSVGTTENIILTSVLSKGITRIYNPALEPEIYCLCDFLNGAGAKITWFNGKYIYIEGVEKLHNSEYEIPPDRIVAGTYLAAVAIVGGEALLHGVIENDLDCVIRLLRNMGCEIQINNEEAYIKRKHKLMAPEVIITEPFPGFPTDLQSQFMVLLSQANGDSVIIEKIFDDRLKTVDELNKLSAGIIKRENLAFIHGNRKLIGTAVEAKDLRGGAALVIAGLVATGETTISNIDYIERGYIDIVKDLKNLQANVKYID